MTATVETSVSTTAIVKGATLKTVPAKKAAGPRFSFTGKGWTASIASGAGIALKPANREKLLAQAISLKVGSPSDLKKLKQETLLAKVAKALAPTA